MSKKNDKENDDLKSMLERLIEEVRELKARIKKLETLKSGNFRVTTRIFGKDN